MQTYLVGGAVRDEIMGHKTRDLDYVVVLDEADLRRRRPARMDEPYTPVDPFKIMVENLRFMGFKIFLKSPEFLTVRAQFPKVWFPTNLSPTIQEGHRPNLTADFVLARKESGYTDGRRPDKVEVGTLEDDLARRDFTMNAVAQDENGYLIDPFNGVQDIEDRIIRAVGDPFERLEEDALRAVRALRFSVTKGFTIDRSLHLAMQSEEVLNAIKYKISDERIQAELSKMFRYDSHESMRALMHYRGLTSAMFSGSVSLDATMKQRGRGE